MTNVDNHDLKLVVRDSLQPAAVKQAAHPLKVLVLSLKGSDYQVSDNIMGKSPTETIE